MSFHAFGVPEDGDGVDVSLEFVFLLVAVEEVSQRGAHEFASTLVSAFPDQPVHALYEVIRERGYKGRSELVRAALRDFLNRHKEEDELKGHVNAIAVLGYPERMERHLSDVRHAHNDLLTSMLHAHTTNGRCATILVGEGADHKMKKFFAELRGLKELDFLNITLL